MKVTVLKGKETYIRHGFGIQTWPDGAKYEGDWRNDMIQGKGTFVHPNGDLYYGMFYQDRANGKGTYELADNRQQYSGEWKNDLYHG